MCYLWSVSDVIACNNLVNSYFNVFAYNSVVYETHSAANLLTELLMFRDLVFCFSNGFSLCHDELNNIIIYVCVN